MEIIMPPNAGQDVLHPELLYKFRDLQLSQGSVFPDVIDVHQTENQNQYTNKRTRNCCTIYGLDHTRKNTDIDIADDNTAEEISLNIVLPKFPFVETEGRSMTGALQVFKNNLLTHGFAVLDNMPEAVQMALYIGRAVYCGTNMIDWLKTRQNNAVAVLSEKPSTGHVFCVDKIDMVNKFVGVHDSEGPAGRGNAGHFRIPFDIFFNNCYTKIILLRENETKSLQEITDNFMLDKAVSLGITNGQLLDTNITRQQAAVMAYRTIHGENVEFDFADAQAIATGIYNGLHKMEKATREQIMLMCASILGVRIAGDDDASIAKLINAGITSGMNRLLESTRRDAILLFVRTLIAKSK